MPYCDMLHVDLVSNVAADALGNDAVDAHNLLFILVNHLQTAVKQCLFSFLS